MNLCTMCRMNKKEASADLCADCQRTVERGYEISALAGRCANGAERDSGTRFHALMLDDNNNASYKALCGQAPGKRSAGWSSWSPPDRVVTCPRCLKKLARMGK